MIIENIIIYDINTVPSPDNAAPAQVIEDTVLLAKGNYQSLSLYSPLLENMKYDKEKFLHVKITWFDKLIAFCFKVLLPFHKRKLFFITTNSESIAYYIAILRFFFFNRPKNVVIHVGFGLIQILKKVYPNVNIAYYHHGTILHTILQEEQWQRIIKSANLGIFGVNKVAIHEANKVFKIKHPVEKYYTVYNGIEILYSDIQLKELRQEFREKLGFTETDFVFIYAGRITPAKGLLNLFQSFLKISKNNSSVKLLIIGGNPKDKRKMRLIQNDDYIVECEKVVDEYPELIKMTGKIPREEVLKYMACSDVFVLPTDKKLSEEGLPLSILEAFSVKLPVIGTRVGGVPEVVIEGVNGKVVSGFDYVDELAEAMQFFAKNPLIAKEYGLKSFEFAQKVYTMDNMVETFESYMQKITK